ncbi:MAG: hypothetical protein WDN25_09635 [Acetobacteraceae bacterium]
MQKTLIALAAAAGLIGLGATAASAAPRVAAPAPLQASAIQQADWYCGPRCRSWQHRRWESRHHYSRGHRSPYYGYNYNYAPNHRYYR